MDTLDIFEEGTLRLEDTPSDKCYCFYCYDKVDGHGEDPCEYYKHHCDACHEKKIFTADECYLSSSFK